MRRMKYGVEIEDEIDSINYRKITEKRKKRRKKRMKVVEIKHRKAIKGSSLTLDGFPRKLSFFLLL